MFASINFTFLVFKDLNSITSVISAMSRERQRMANCIRDLEEALQREKKEKKEDEKKEELAGKVSTV